MVFKSLSPFVDYAINKEYIAKVLCINQEKPELACHGKCHLKKELTPYQRSFPSSYKGSPFQIKSWLS